MPTNPVTHWKNLKIQDIDFTVPEKIKGKYVSYVADCKSKSPLYVQTPTMVVHHVANDKKTMTFRLKHDAPFVGLLQGLDDHIATSFADNSTKFFNGKSFSKAKIINAYLPAMQFADGNVLLTLNVHHALVVRDQRDVIRNIEDVHPGTEAVAVIDIECVNIGKSSIRPIFTLQQTKIYVKDSLTDWCIQNDSDWEDEEPVVLDEKDVEEQIAALERAANINRDDVPLTEKDEKKVNDTVIAERDAEHEREAVSLNDDDKDFF